MGKLTADDLRLVLKVEPELQAAGEKLARPGQPIRYEPFDKFVELVEATSEFKAVFDKYHINARDFFLVLDTTIRALHDAAEVSQNGSVASPDVALVLNPPEDIATSFARWRRARFSV